MVQNLKIVLIITFISSKLWSDTCQEESPEWRAKEKERLFIEKSPRRDWLKTRPMRERHYCTIFFLYTNSFCRQRAGLEVLMKVVSRADRWKGEWPWARIENLLSS